MSARVGKAPFLRVPASPHQPTEGQQLVPGHERGVRLVDHGPTVIPCDRLPIGRCDHAIRTALSAATEKVMETQRYKPCLQPNAA